MQGLGRRMRRAREAIGISQADLARAAGVSQGAISRLETGRGLATPLLVVLKTAIGIREAGRRIAPEAMPEEGAMLLESLTRHLGRDGRFDQGGIGLDAEAVELVAAFRSLPERERRTILASVKAAAGIVADAG
jgi:transcriptional regulator with XRE-family HTH domain